MRQRFLVARLAAVVLLACLPAPAAHAWGPHPAITRAACAVIPAADGLDARLLGVGVLDETCWLADYKGDAFGDWYPDDFLLFPGFSRHPSHLAPAVEEAWEPFFGRALQAMRTETPLNAARWVGSLLHFQQDSGSPPHALPLGGELHSRLENWVDAAAIRIPGYRPQLLGATDAAAVEGFRARMQGLVAYSRRRAEQAKPLAEAGNRAAVEPVVLESALETARVTADVLHTLLVLSRAAAGSQPDRAEMSVRISGPRHPSLPKSPARLVLLGTPYATVADAGPDARGDYEATASLRNLPPGRYRAVVYRTGFVPVSLADLNVAAGRPLVRAVRFEPDPTPGNLVRDSQARVSYSAPGQPEHWRRVGTGAAAAWETAAIPVREGATYRIRVRLGEGAAAVVQARWDPYIDFGKELQLDLIGSDPAGGYSGTAVVPPAARLLRLLIRTPAPLAAVEQAAVTLEPAVPLVLAEHFQRDAGGSSVREAEWLQTRRGDAVVQVSRTFREGVESEVEVERGPRGDLRSGLVTLITAGQPAAARIEMENGRARVVDAAGQEHRVDCPPEAIVTSAPDWSDIIQVCRRYDPQKGEAQSFPGLWVHPRQPPRAVTFRARTVMLDRVQWGFLWLPVRCLEIELRPGDRYHAWVLEDGRLIALANSQGALVMFREGYEAAARALMAARVPSRSKQASWFSRIQRPASRIASASVRSPSATSASSARVSQRRAWME